MGLPFHLNQGLSPRVRGNHGRRRGALRRSGSIPASAGEPPACTTASSERRVYPRECGGTRAAFSVAVAPTGLSPRVRGNRDWQFVLRDSAGSIPASAGEPRAGTATTNRSRVYPRECGGTRRRACRGRLLAGLSPRVRGNRSMRNDAKKPCRSIPASAGEPRFAIRADNQARVYPCECGGTW